jgi:fermentation-respiration switch protein FrsA (DUF1100 family)
MMNFKLINYKKYICFIFLIFCNAQFVSCNSLFYYPQKKIIMTPDNFGLKYDSFTISSEENININLWYIHAQNEKPIATIIHFHGNGENISTHFLYFAWLAKLGFDIVEFDYRGYGFSTGEPSRAGLIKDAEAIYNWVNNNSRSKEIFIIAQSLGGAVAIPSYVISKVTDVDAIILESTFSSYREIAQKKLANFWLTWPLQWPLRFLVSDEYSSIDYIHNIDIPILYIHSFEDPVVPYESGLILYDKAPELKELWSIPWPGHTAAFSNNDNTYRKQLINYMCKHLKINNISCDSLYENYKDPIMSISKSE